MRLGDSLDGLDSQIGLGYPYPGGAQTGLLRFAI